MSEKRLQGEILTTGINEILNVVGLSLLDVGKFVRLDDQMIRKLRNVATCLPSPLVDKVFSTEEVSLSGDWVVGIAKDANSNPWVVLLLERGSLYKEEKYGKHFAQTSFALSSVGVGDLIYQNLHADYKNGSSGEHLRYTPVHDYNEERNKIKKGIPYEVNVCLQDPGLSAIADIWNRGFEDAMRKV